jgi:hypothetical protein
VAGEPYEVPTPCHESSDYARLYASMTGAPAPSGGPRVAEPETLTDASDVVAAFVAGAAR